MRVYEIAKEVGIPNKDLIAKIRALGLEVNNHMSSLDADDVARIKRSLEKEKQSVAQPQQTQRLATGGAVLRRRSSGDRPAEGAGDDRSSEPVRARGPEAERHPPPGPPAAAAAPPPVFRRRVVAEEPPGAAHGAATSAPRPVVRAPESSVAPAAAAGEPAPRVVTARPERVEARPVERVEVEPRVERRSEPRIEVPAEPVRPAERVEAREAPAEPREADRAHSAEPARVERRSEPRIE